MENKNSEYYLGNRDTLPVILSLKTDKQVINIELPWDAGMEELCQAFYTACIGISWDPDNVVRGMQNFANDLIGEEN